MMRPCVVVQFVAAASAAAQEGVRTVLTETLCYMERARAANTAPATPGPPAEGTAAAWLASIGIGGSEGAAGAAADPDGLVVASAEGPGPGLRAVRRSVACRYPCARAHSSGAADVPIYCRVVGRSTARRRTASFCYRATSSLCTRRCRTRWRAQCASCYIG